MLRYYWKIVFVALAITLNASLVFAKATLLYQNFDDCNIKVTAINNQRFIEFNSKGKTLETYKTTDGFVTGFILENNKYITIWETGSALKIVIFLIKETSVLNILTVSSYSPPEIIDVDNDGEFELVFWEGKFMTSGKQIIERPKQAKIYKFNGSKYVNIETRPWESRFAGGRVSAPINSK